MKVQLISDVHVELWPEWKSSRMWLDFLDQIQTDADILVAAGDMFSLKASRMSWTIARLQELGSRYEHVLFVGGNHEFYGTSIAQGMDQLLAADRMVFTNVKVLHSGKVITIDGQRFLGDTGWFPLPPMGAQTILDHNRIVGLDPDAYIAHRAFRNFLDTDLQEGDFVVSHHLPSNKSISAKYTNDPANPFFVTPDLEFDFIIPKQPAIWVHGHTHTGCEYNIGKTRVICNPKGYVGERTTFDYHKLIEL